MITSVSSSEIPVEKSVGNKSRIRSFRFSFCERMNRDKHFITYLKFLSSFSVRGFFLKDTYAITLC